MEIFFTFFISKSVADPGFPRRGANFKRGGIVNFLFGQILLKLHKNEEIWTGRGGGVQTKFYHVDLPFKVQFVLLLFFNFSFETFFRLFSQQTNYYFYHYLLFLQ